MKFLDSSTKTNWKYILIVAVLGIIVGSIVAWLGAYSDLFDTRNPKGKIQRIFPIQAEEQTCVVDADCVAVYADCSNCSCTAVNKRYEQKYQKTLLCQNYQGPVCDYDCFPQRQLTKCINNHCQLSEELSSENATKSWQTYRNSEFGFEVKYPPYWKLEQGYDDRYGSDDGFFQFSAIDGRGWDIEEVYKLDAYHKLKPYGSNPIVENLIIGGQEARLILPSEDQPKAMKSQAGVVVRYPAPVFIGGYEYHYFVLWVDQNHIRQILSTFRFVENR